METMLAARTRYFEDNHFGADGGYGDKWVEIKLGPLPMRLRNSAARVKAVRYHDMHHVATGYKTDLPGEMEIAAWELGAGCRSFVAAWLLNLGAVGGGLFGAPRRTFRAFVRGRRSRSLYGQDVEALLARPVADVKRAMGLVPEPQARASAADAALFAAAGIAGAAVGSVLFGAALVASAVSVVARWLGRGASAPAAAPGSPAPPSR